MSRRTRKTAAAVGPRSKAKAFWEQGCSGGANESLYYYHFWRLTELTVSMFEWKGLPDTVDARYMELALFSDGQAIAFKDDAIGLVVTRCTAAGPYNIYGYPVRRQAFTDSGYTNVDLDETNSVICWNNYLRKPTFYDADIFALRMADMDAAVMVNVKAQKTPVLVSCDESQVPTMKRVYEEYDGNKPVIFGSKAVNKNSLEVMQTGSPYVASDIYDLKVQYNNEYLTRIGISNMNIAKRERMITEEVQRNMGATVSSRYSPLDMRRKFCKEVNEMFGENWSCDYKEDYRDIEDGKNTTVSGQTSTGETVELSE